MANINVVLNDNLCTTCQLDGHSGSIRTAYNTPREDMNPGELLAAALGACMLTMVGFLATRRGENVAGTTAQITPTFDEKHSRVTAFTVTFTFPAHLTQIQKDFYANAAQSCPVHNSLKEDITYNVIVK